MPRRQTRRGRPGGRPAATGVLVGAALAGFCLAFVADRIASQWDQVRDQVAGASVGWIVAAVACAGAGMTWIAACWGRALALSGPPPPQPAAIAWYYGGEIGKYVPGAVWPVVGRAELAHRGGVPRARAYAGVALSLAALYLAALAVAAVLVPFDLARQSASPGALALLALLPLGLAALAPRVLTRVRAAAVRVTGRGGDVAVPPWRDTVGLVAAYVPAWLCIWAATWCTARALLPNPPVLRIGIATTLSWTAGFVAVPVPAGAGVREAVFVAAAGLPPGLGATVAVGGRLAFVLVDVAGALLTAPGHRQAAARPPAVTGDGVAAAGTTPAGATAGTTPAGATAGGGGRPYTRRHAPDTRRRPNLPAGVTGETADLARGVLGGDRRALARSITLIESTRAEQRARAANLLDAVLPATGRAVRVGVSGTPGAGKSTFIDALGSHLTGAGHHVAVLAVDPSSRRSGGSIMGDKTRMERLARDPAAFVRPSPSGGSLGGVARRTREAALLCEAAGFDVVIVETVGVGQSETAVADMVDCFVLVAAPGAGDELQGIKRGVTELADVIVVNKADGDLLPAARRAVADHRQAAHLIRPKHPGWSVPVVAVSSLHGTGIDDVWAAVEELERHLRRDGSLDGLRSAQAVAWMWAEMRDRLVEDLRRDERVAARLAEAEADVGAGRVSPTAAAHELLAAHGLAGDDEG